MKKKHKEIIGKIRYIATDKRERVLISDELDWMNTKMKEIKRLIKKLPYKYFDGKL